jgi:hypothetical protein
VIYSISSGLTISGCTFYRNSVTSGSTGVFTIGNNANTTLRGNLFWGNTAKVVHLIGTGTVTSLGYNVSDRDATGSNFTFVTGDKQLTTPTQDPLVASDPTHPYKPAAASLSDITIVDTSALSGYPATDFYGTSRSGTVPAGAVGGYAE